MVRRCVFALLSLATATVFLATPMTPSASLASVTTGAARNPYTQPFASTSIWNQPIGSGAVYVPAQIAPPTGRAITADQTLVLMDPSAPVTPIYANSGQHGNRCVAATPILSAPLPSSLVVPSSTGNLGYTVVGSDGSSLVEGNAFARCALGGPATAWDARSFGSIYGDGLTGAAGGSGLSTLGGILRVNELVPGGTIDHAIRVNLQGAANLFAGPNGFRWPATHEDGYGPTVYGGHNPALKMGALLALPSTLNLAALGLTSGPGLILARALQAFGAYVSNDTVTSVFSVATETGDASMTDQFLSAWGYPFQAAGVGGSAWANDVMLILSQLAVVDNNGPASIGGGGAPLVSPPPPPSTSGVPPVPAAPAMWGGQHWLSDGPLGGDPQAVAGGVGRSYVFWRGTDNSLWYDWYNGAWHGAAPLTGGSALKPGTDPHPVATGNGTIDVFWEGGDGNLWHVWEVNGSGFAPPTRLGGGPLGSQPQPVSSGHGDVAVFWMGSDASANLWEAAYRPSTGWRLPIGLGSGPLGGAPHAAAFATTSYDVFWQGTDGNIWHTYSFGSSWSGPQFLGMGPLGGDPIAISAAANTIDLYWQRRERRPLARLVQPAVGGPADIRWHDGVTPERRCARSRSAGRLLAEWQHHRPPRRRRCHRAC